MAKVLGNQQRKAAIAWMVARIVKYNVRFVLGDFNMSAFQLLDDLRACGIECLVVSQHVELDWQCENYLYDSCVIVAIGGRRYFPKPNTLSSHCLMAAQVYDSDSKGDRGFPVHSYIFAKGVARPDGAIRPDLIKQVRALRRLARDRSNCQDCTDETQCQAHEYEPFNERESPITEHPAEQGDQSMKVTAEFPVLLDMKGLQCRPTMWDPTKCQWGKCAHWSLYLSVGSQRARSAKGRSDRYAKNYHKWHPTRKSAPAAASSGQASSSQSAPAARPERKVSFTPRSRTEFGSATPTARSDATRSPRSGASSTPRSRAVLNPRGDRWTDGGRRRWSSAEQRRWNSRGPWADCDACRFSKNFCCRTRVRMQGCKFRQYGRTSRQLHSAHT